MTLIVGRKFPNGSIVVGSDTMISAPGRMKPDRIPGVLKAVIFTPNLSVAFSGHVETGLDALREAKRIIDNPARCLPDLLEQLAAASRLSQCDFLIASHLRGPELLKVHNGLISADQEMHWAGDPSPLKELETEYERQLRAYSTASEIPKGYTREELAFSSNFTSFFLRQPCYSDSIGGFPMIINAYPGAHHYSNNAGVCLTRDVTIQGGPCGEGRDASVPADATYSYNIIAAAPLGCGIVGAYLRDARVGYIYTPLARGKVLVRIRVDMDAMSDEIRSLAAAG